MIYSYHCAISQYHYYFRSSENDVELDHNSVSNMHHANMELILNENQKWECSCENFSKNGKFNCVHLFLYVYLFPFLFLNVFLDLLLNF
jgi:hypothetical protein